MMNGSLQAPQVLSLIIDEIGPHKQRHPIIVSLVDTQTCINGVRAVATHGSVPDKISLQIKRGSAASGIEGFDLLSMHVVYSGGPFDFDWQHSGLLPASETETVLTMYRLFRCFALGLAFEPKIFEVRMPSDDQSEGESRPFVPMVCRMFGDKIEVEETVPA